MAELSDGTPIVLMACSCYAWPVGAWGGTGRCGFCGTPADVFLPTFDDEEIYARPLTDEEKWQISQQSR